MSTLMVAASDAVNFPPLSLAIAAVAALALAGLAGVFNPRRIAGPARLSLGESPVVLLSVIGFGLMGWAATTFVLGAYQQAEQHAAKPPARLTAPREVIFGIAMDLAVFLAMLIATVLMRREGVKRVGLSVREFPRGLVRGIFWIVVAFPLVLYIDVVTEFVLDRLHKAHPPHDLLLVLKDTPQRWLHVAVVISAAVTAPVAEEMLFRGHLQTFVRYTLKRPWAAVVVAAALFALVHPPSSWPAIFFLGICLGYVYERSGNLWTSIVMHSIFNLTSIALFWTSLNHGG